MRKANEESKLMIRPTAEEEANDRAFQAHLDGECAGEPECYWCVLAMAEYVDEQRKKLGEVKHSPPLSGTSFNAMLRKDMAEQLKERHAWHLPKATKSTGGV